MREYFRDAVEQPAMGSECSFVVCEEFRQQRLALLLIRSDKAALEHGARTFGHHGAEYLEVDRRLAFLGQQHGHGCMQVAGAVQQRAIQVEQNQRRNRLRHRACVPSSGN